MLMLMVILAKYWHDSWDGYDGDCDSFVSVSWTFFYFDACLRTALSFSWFCFGSREGELASLQQSRNDVKSNEWVSE